MSRALSPSAASDANMIAVNPFQTEAPFAEDFSRTRDQSSHAEAVELRDSSAQQKIDQLILGIEPVNLRDLMRTIFNDLLGLLECLSLLESRLPQINDASESFTLFQLVHDEASSLVKFIRTQALSSDAMIEPLAETLDGVAFAVNHDLRRVFEGGEHQLVDEAADHLVVGKLYRAHDVMTNCLQQSTITLAMFFDPQLIASRLFNNSDMRLRQSMQLCQDLSTLIEYVADYEDGENQTPARVLEAIETFRNESMQFLMYSDWPQFESFCERLISAAPRQTDLLPVLHRFRCYLETLLGQVRMRAVLADVFSPSLNETRSFQLERVFSENSSPSAPRDLQNLDTVWGTMAMAF